MYRILSVSRNTSLLLSRNDALAVAGFSVVSPRTPEETPALAAEQQVDAVVIGHSVEADVRRKLIHGLRKSVPDALIVYVYAGPGDRVEPLADMSLDLTHGAESLILALQAALSGAAD